MSATIFDRIDGLVAELSQLAPPPPKAQGLDLPIGSVGRWVVAEVGQGFYSLRAEYVTPIGRKVVGEPVDELIGQPQALMMALDFAVKLAKASRFEWRRCQ